MMTPAEKALLVRLTELFLKPDHKAITCGELARLRDLLSEAEGRR